MGWPPCHAGSAPPFALPPERREGAKGWSGASERGPGVEPQGAQPLTEQRAPLLSLLFTVLLARPISSPVFLEDRAGLQEAWDHASRGASPPVCAAARSGPPLPPRPSPNPRAQVEGLTQLPLLAAFVDLPELLQHLDNNFKYWKGLDERKLRSLRPPTESQ